MTLDEFNWIWHMNDLKSKVQDGIISAFTKITDSEDIGRFVNDKLMWNQFYPFLLKKTQWTSETQASIDALYNEFKTHLNSEYSMNITEFKDYSTKLVDFNGLKSVAEMLIAFGRFVVSQ